MFHKEVADNREVRRGGEKHEAKPLPMLSYYCRWKLLLKGAFFL